MRTMKNLALAAMAAAALALAGCGGGGSSSSAPPAGPTAAEMLAERQMEQRNAISTAITMAETAVAGVNDDSTDSEVSAADTAVAAARTAIANAADLPAEETAANTGTVNVIANRLTAAKTSRMTAMGEADKAKQAAMAKTGKALHAALGPPGTADTTALNNIAAPTLTSAGLAVDAASGAGALADGTGGTTAVDPALVTLKAGDSAGALGSWMGTDYAHTDSTTKVKNEARVYINRGTPKTQTFVSKYGDATEYTASTRTYNVGDTADPNIKASAFPTAGATTFTGAQSIPGTYDGADGDYKCAAAASCTATFNAAGIQLSADWTFVHDSGASVSTPDANYLYYGWWVSKDKDGGPTAASAFIGEVGDVDNVGTTAGDTASGADLTGSATYAGKAAGKFAMTNVLDGTGNGGHFTADAMLTAKFGAIAADNENGVKGMIDNFRLNDGSEDPGWSVTLNRSSAWVADGVITGPTSNATVWSINGNKAPASGAWSGQMHDEMPGNTPGGDGSNVPTTMMGTFYSEFSTIGRMVGAFGAEKQ